MRNSRHALPPSASAIPAGDEPLAPIERHYSVNQVAEATGKSNGLIRKLVANREIAHVRLGTAIAIPESSLRDFLDRNRVPARERLIA